MLLYPKRGNESKARKKSNFRKPVEAGYSAGNEAHSFIAENEPDLCVSVGEGFSVLRDDGDDVLWFNLGKIVRHYA